MYSCMTCRRTSVELTLVEVTLLLSMNWNRRGGLLGAGDIIGAIDIRSRLLGLWESDIETLRDAGKIKSQ